VVKDSVGLLLIYDARTAELFDLEVDIDLDPVGDLDEGDAAVDAVVLAVEGHGSLDRALAGALAGDGEVEGFGLGDAAYGEVADYVEGGGAGLDDLGGVEGDGWILVDVEEVFALQLAVLHAASGVHAGGLDLDVEHGRGYVGGGEGEGGVPFVEDADDGDGGLDEELDVALFDGGGEDGGTRLSAGGGRKEGERKEGDDCQSHDALEFERLGRRCQ
jgi:hypothetical protein